MLIFITAVSVVLGVSFICSICESVLLSLSRPRIESMAQEGSRAGRLLVKFRENMDVPIAAILILNTAAHTIGAAVAGASYTDVFGAGTLWAFSLVFTLAVLLFTEIIPKTVGVYYADKLATGVAYTIDVLTKLLKPMIVVSEAISSSLRPKGVKPVTSNEDIRLMAQLGRSEGVVGDKAAHMIIGATELGKMTARDVMLPRQDVKFLTTDMRADEVLANVREWKHSRLPVATDHELESAKSVILVKELLSWMLDHPGKDIDWNTLHREPLVVPEQMSLRQLLHEYQHSRRHLALVVNEYGETEGIATMEDLLEEIVGDIYDESDAPLTEVSYLPDGSLQVDAGVDLRKLCHLLHANWDSDQEAATAGGMVTDMLERMPVPGDHILWNGYRIDVLVANEKKVQTLRITPLSEPA